MGSGESDCVAGFYVFSQFKGQKLTIDQGIFLNGSESDVIGDLVFGGVVSGLNDLSSTRDRED